MILLTLRLWNLREDLKGCSWVSRLAEQWMDTRWIAVCSFSFLFRSNLIYSRWRNPCRRPRNAGQHWGEVPPVDNCFTASLGLHCCHAVVKIENECWEVFIAGVNRSEEAANFHEEVGASPGSSSSSCVLYVICFCVLHLDQQDKD